MFRSIGVERHDRAERNSALSNNESQNMDITTKHNTAFSRGARPENDAKRDARNDLPSSPLKFHKTAKSVEFHGQ
jgi:hypothetical protein